MTLNGDWWTSTYPSHSPWLPFSWTRWCITVQKGSHYLRAQGSLGEITEGLGRKCHIKGINIRPAYWLEDWKRYLSQEAPGMFIRLGSVRQNKEPSEPGTLGSETTNDWVSYSYTSLSCFHLNRISLACIQPISFLPPLPHSHPILYAAVYAMV